MAQQTDTSQSVLKFIGGALLGVVLTFVYERHSWTLPEVATDKPALCQAWERKHGKTNDDEELKRCMQLSALPAAEFSSWSLPKRFLQLTKRDWIDPVLNVYMNELRPEICVAVEQDAARCNRQFAT